MEMIEVKTSELIGPALDWATAKASETKIDDSRGKELRIDIAPGLQSPWAPSVNWYQGGPLIDKYRVSFVTSGTGPEDDSGNEPIVALTSGLNYKAANGKTHLLAACRAIVAENLGPTISVPKELMQ